MEEKCVEQKPGGYLKKKDHSKSREKDIYFPAVASRFLCDAGLEVFRSAPFYPIRESCVKQQLMLFGNQYNVFSIGQMRSSSTVYHQKKYTIR